jgi:hypothetical protein
MSDRVPDIIESHRRNEAEIPSGGNCLARLRMRVVLGLVLMENACVENRGRTESCGKRWQQGLSVRMILHAPRKPTPPISLGPCARLARRQGRNDGLAGDAEGSELTVEGEARRIRLGVYVHRSRPIWALPGKS